MEQIIQKKLDDLKQQKEQHIANLNACIGAIQVLELLLEDLKQNEPLNK